MAYEKYTVKQFIDAWFNKDYSELTEDEFKIVYSEYQDESGLFMSEDFEKQSFIYHLNQRITFIKMFLRLQREFISEFESPFIRDFEMVKDRYGYNLKWNNDINDFEEQLKKIELREVKHTTLLESKIKDFVNSRKKDVVKNNDEVEDLKKSRSSFIRMLNSLGKIGFIIDKKETTVEELSLMIKQQMEEVSEYNQKQYAR